MTPSATVRRWLGAVRMDVTPLRRYGDYRRLYLASAVSLLGSTVTMVAAPLQLKELTGSYVAVGLLGAAEFLPLVVFGLLGGAIADAHDRRRIAVLTEVLGLACTAVLMLNALLPHPQTSVIYLAAAASAGAYAVQRPSTDAMMPRLVAPQHQSAASALTGLQFDGGALIAPALGGVLAVYSLPAAYALDAVSFVASLALLLRLSPMPAQDTGQTVSLSAIGAGLRYAVSRRELLGTYLIDVVAMAFAMPQALYPFYADQLGHPGALGLFYSAGAVGSVLVTLTSGWTSRIHRHGLAIVLAATVWGANMAVAGIAPTLWAVLLALAVAGGADMVSGIFRGTVWNQTIPDHLRGRLAGIELLSYTSGPTLGNARAGLMARWGGVRFSVGAGGLLCVAAVGVTALALPSLIGYDARTNRHAVAERERRAASGPAPPAEPTTVAAD